jgi:glyoxylase-like metal-dependent hydrolase (beta-lactamase superfamily II)
MKALPVALCALLMPAAHAARIMDGNLAGRVPERISEHVYEIEGFPDIEFVVGTQGTLVVDTGLGPGNGAIVAAAAKRLAQGPKLYLVTTHYHPEHSSGDGGFPADTVIVRSHVQQEELSSAKFDAMVTRFRGQSQFAAFLPEKIVPRQPNVLFDSSYTLDLGGVHARVDQVGPAHTLGDEVIWVPEDRTLISGDIAIHDEPPRVTVEGVSPKDWIPLLDRLAALQPLHVVPDHGEPGDLSLITAQRELLLHAPAPDKKP